jgi:putative ABC transport system permease protein
MNRIKLICRNLWFNRKPYLALLAGVFISTASITGALIVGDSVRFSLQQLADSRLGSVRYSLQTTNRFFSQKLAVEMATRLHTPVLPALCAEGIAINSDKNLRINKVQITGIDAGFGTLWEHPLSPPGQDEVIISNNVAKRLKLNPGDDLLLRIHRNGLAPPGAPFVAERAPSVSVRVKVAAIADDRYMGRFSTKNNQTAPFNIFLSLQQMASLMELNGYANLLLVPGKNKPELTASALDSTLKQSWNPADAGVVFRKLKDGENSEITTDRIFFDSATAKAVMMAIPGCKPILTYLANSISAGHKTTPYSFVTAAGETYLKRTLGKREILINDWLAKDIGAGTGDQVMLRYFLIGPLRTLREDSMQFTVKSVVPMGDSLLDPDLMPRFPGMSDAGSCRDWETGAPVDLKKIRQKDEEYWKHYHGTPKAFISLSAGQEIWNNRFGNYTAFRFRNSRNNLSQIESSLMQRMNPARYGLFFKPVYQEGQLAAYNSTDFGELFLSMSFFLLASALLLTAMMFLFHAESRMPETGILSALGFRKRLILGILAFEAAIVSIVGSIAGTFGGIAYNYLLIHGLNTIWQDAVNTSLLVMKIRLTTLLAGSITGIITSLLLLLLILWKNLREPLSGLVKGSTGMRDRQYGKVRFPARLMIAVVSIGGSLGLIVGNLVIRHDMNNSMVLIAGGLMIPGGLALMDLLLLKKISANRSSIPGFFRLALKNLSLQRGRTISAVALLALGTFSIIITGAHSKTALVDENTRQSGTGGFLFWAESAFPVMNDLNTAHGAGLFGIRDEEALKSARFIQIPQLDGDDASCKNLNQVAQPGVLGVPAALFDRLSAFNFVSVDQSVDKTHPWKTLSSALAPGIICGFADQSVITYGLRKSVGDTLTYRDESNGILKIRLAGGLDNSIFQGNVLVSDDLLRKFYPSIGGTRIMLIDGPVKQRDLIAERMETLFRDYGLTVTPAPEKLGSFNAVENTYLSVFMMLGGLGVILGTIGLGIVLLRNTTQRRQELALYIALGFGKKFVFRIIVAEHMLILLSGLFLGLVSALPGIVPLMTSCESKVPWMSISAMLLVVFVNGLLWILIPAGKIVSRDPLPYLRVE